MPPHALCCGGSGRQAGERVRTPSGTMYDGKTFWHVPKSKQVPTRRAAADQRGPLHKNSTGDNAALALNHSLEPIVGGFVHRTSERQRHEEADDEDNLPHAGREARPEAAASRIISGTGVGARIYCVCRMREAISLRSPIAAIDGIGA